MTNAEAIQEFIQKCDELIAEAEGAIIKAQDEDKATVYVYNLALKNVKSYREAAVNGVLRPSQGSGFGVSKADLNFGEIEEKLYDLERFYIKNL